MLENISAAPAKAYSSVQYGPGEHDHLELNSDLLFSTSPSLLLPRRISLPHRITRRESCISVGLLFQELRVESVIRDTQTID